jgi:hypothetical protein
VKQVFALPQPVFASAQEMIRVHRGMFGPAGEIVAGYVLKYAPVLFDVALDPLAFRVVLAPGEQGPYGRHTGYTMTDAGFILLNRFCCGFNGGEIFLLSPAEDVIVHELTHTRQAMLRGSHHRKRGSRGSHRDAAWYEAISEAAPRYLGVRFEPEVWPAWRSVCRNGHIVGKEPRPGTLDEVRVCHWPGAMRKLVSAGDKRLPRC